VAELLIFSALRLFEMRHVVVDDATQSQRQVGKDMTGGQHFQHRQIRHRGKGVVMQFKPGGAGPSAFYRHILKVILDQFANPRRAIDIRDDL
jgi:hypothetical protein